MDIWQNSAGNNNSRWTTGVTIPIGFTFAGVIDIKLGPTCKMDSLGGNPEPTGKARLRHPLKVRHTSLSSDATRVVWE